MMEYLGLLIFMFFSGLYMFSFSRSHLLLMLLSVEFIMLSLYLGLYLYVSLGDFEYFFVLVYLTMSVCEGTLGLAMLISMMRSHGNDYIMTFSSLW